MSEIESRLYDQFNITVRDVKVLLADSGEYFPSSQKDSSPAPSQPGCLFTISSVI